MIKIIFIAFGVLFVLIGIGVLIGGLASNNSMKNSREVSGKIVDFIEKKYRNKRTWSTAYYPVYEYYDSGEFKRHESNIYQMPQKPLGTEVTLYISEDGKVRETPGCFDDDFDRSYFCGIWGIFCSCCTGYIVTGGRHKCVQKQLH